MIALTALVCWLIICAYVPLVIALTQDPSLEVRRVTNALVMQRALLVSAAEPVVMSVRVRAVDVGDFVKRWRAAGGETAPTLTAAAPVFALDLDEVA